MVNDATRATLARLDEIDRFVGEDDYDFVAVIAALRDLQADREILLAENVVRRECVAEAHKHLEDSQAYWSDNEHVLQAWAVLAGDVAYNDKEQQSCFHDELLRRRKEVVELKADRARAIEAAYMEGVRQHLSVNVAKGYIEHIWSSSQARRDAEGNE